MSTDMVVVICFLIAIFLVAISNGITYLIDRIEKKKEKNQNNDNSKTKG